MQTIFEIIRTIDFSRIRPAVLIYEHKHLGPADRLACWRLLRANGYRCAAGWSDTLAILAGQSASLASAAMAASVLPAPFEYRTARRC